MKAFLGLIGSRLSSLDSLPGTGVNALTFYLKIAYEIILVDRVAFELGSHRSHLARLDATHRGVPRKFVH